MAAKINLKHDWSVFLHLTLFKTAKTDLHTKRVENIFKIKKWEWMVAWRFNDWEFLQQCRLNINGEFFDFLEKSWPFEKGQKNLLIQRYRMSQVNGFTVFSTLLKNNDVSLWRLISDRGHIIVSQLYWKKKNPRNFYHEALRDHNSWFFLCVSVMLHSLVAVWWLRMTYG